MINFGLKTKISRKSKKVRKVSSRVPRRPLGYFALTPEDVAEMNRFSLAAAKSVVAADEREQVKARAKKQSKAKR